VVELESPKIGGGDGGLGRGGSAHVGHRFVVGVEGDEATSSGMLSSRTVSRSGESTIEL
jgi:hypothetical protein